MVRYPVPQQQQYRVWDYKKTHQFLRDLEPNDTGLILMNSEKGKTMVRIGGDLDGLRT